MRRSLEVEDARRLLGGAPVVLVTTRWRDETDVMPVIWSTPVSARPPLVAIAVHPSRYTHDMIRFSEEFALNFPSPALLHHVQYFGMVSGREINKIEAAKLPTFPAHRVSAPLLEHCVGWVECGVEDALRLGDHTLFVGRVVAVSAESEAFEEVWKLEAEEMRPLHYLGGVWYAALEHRREAQVRTTEEGGIVQPEPTGEGAAPQERSQGEEETPGEQG